MFSTRFWNADSVQILIQVADHPGRKTTVVSMECALSSPTMGQPSLPMQHPTEWTQLK